MDKSEKEILNAKTSASDEIDTPKPENEETPEQEVSIESEKPPKLGPKKSENTKKDTEDIQNEQIDLVRVSGVQFMQFEQEEETEEGFSKKNLDIMQDINLKITVELGRTKSSVKNILDMSKGSIVELNKVAGEPVELFVNGQLVAYGEVIVMEEKFGLRVTNIAKLTKSFSS